MKLFVSEDCFDPITGRTTTAHVKNSRANYVCFCDECGGYGTRRLTGSALSFNPNVQGSIR